MNESRVYVKNVSTFEFFLDVGYNLEDQSLKKVDLETWNEAGTKLENRGKGGVATGRDEGEGVATSHEADLRFEIFLKYYRP